jgi:Tol biopolymer transport system component
MLFNQDGNLYFQDGNNPPIKLAQNEKNPYYSFPLYPELSSDNKKVVFFRDDGSIYSINTDGTAEQIIIPKEWLNSQETGTSIDALKFIPRTHLLFLQTVLCKSKESYESFCSASIFLADADTGKIRKLADLGVVLQNDDLSPNIVISPDGRMVAVGTLDGVKIFTLDGRIIRNNVLPYKPSTKYVLFPSLFWLPDSSGLIVALPNTIYHYPELDGTAAYTIWRYKIDSSPIDQILLNPPPNSFFQVSPDGKWIVYGNFNPSPLYLGNLINGRTQVFGADQTPSFYWSPDSKHLIDGDIVFTSFDQPFVFAGVSPKWIDSTHYIYSISPPDNPSAYPERVLIAEIKGDAIVYYESGLLHPSFVTIKPK